MGRAGGDQRTAETGLTRYLRQQMHHQTPSIKNRVYVIKIGGNIIDDEIKLSAFLSDFARLDSPAILVHGGGKLATRMAEDLGLTQQLVEGRRITDGETLK